MNFHQYKWIKKAARITMLLSVSAIFMSLVSSFAVPAYQADDDCRSSFITLEAQGDVSNVQINRNFEIKAINTNTDNSGREIDYEYKIIIRDLTTAKEHPGESGNIKAGQFTFNVKFNTPGRKEVYLSYKPIGECQYVQTNKIALTAVNNIGDSTRISLTAEPNSIIKGSGDNQINIRANITGSNGKIAWLQINTLESSSDWSEKGRWDINNDDYSLNYTWQIDSANTRPGNHGVRLKIYSSNGDLTDLKTVFVNVCDAGTTSCEAGSDTTTDDGNADGGDGEDAPVVSVPTETEVNVAGKPTVFNITRGSGIGGLVRFIILLLLALVGAFSFIGFMVAGIQYITAGGDNSKMEKAKKTMIQAVIAILLAVFSFVIVALVNKYANL